VFLTITEHISRSGMSRNKTQPTSSIGYKTHLLARTVDGRYKPRPAHDRQWDCRKTATGPHIKQIMITI
jgi:hypothetical protein